jgi:hypothetical protein
MKTKNLIEEQQNPNNSGDGTNSQGLCTIELSHRRRCENNTLRDSGATVWATASGHHLVLKVGKCFVINVVKNRSSLGENKFW